MKARNKEKIAHMPHLTAKEYRYSKQKHSSNCNSRENKKQIVSHYNKYISNSHASELSQNYALEEKSINTAHV
jgi:hypothetical protein